MLRLNRYTTVTNITTDKNMVGTSSYSKQYESPGSQNISIFLNVGNTTSYKTEKPGNGQWYISSLNGELDPDGSISISITKTEQDLKYKKNQDEIKDLEKKLKDLTDKIFDDIKKEEEKLKKEGKKLRDKNIEIINLENEDKDTIPAKIDRARIINTIDTIEQKLEDLNDKLITDAEITDIQKDIEKLNEYSPFMDTVLIMNKTSEDLSGDMKDLLTEVKISAVEPPNIDEEVESRKKEWEEIEKAILEDEEEDDDTDDEDIKIFEDKRPTFTLTEEATRTDILDPEDATTCPIEGLIESFDLNYDMSGPTKTLEKNIYENGLLIRKEVEIWGFAFDSHPDSNPVNKFCTIVYETQNNPDSDFYYRFNKKTDILPPDAKNFWKKVEYYTITYYYEEDIGNDGPITGQKYYLGYDKNGQKHVRFLQESSFEALRYSDGGTTAVSEDNNLDYAKLFQWFEVPITEQERLSLHAFEKYYPDTVAKESETKLEYEEYNVDTESLEIKTIDDKRYVLPRFQKEKVVYSRCYAEKIITDKELLNLLGYQELEEYKLSTGQEYKTIERLEIFPKTKQNKSDYYTVYRESTSAQDDGFKNYTKISESEIIEGRPSVVSPSSLYKLNDIQKIQVNKNKQTINNNKPNIFTTKYDKLKKAFDNFINEKQKEDFQRGDKVYLTGAGEANNIVGKLLNLPTVVSLFFEYPEGLVTSQNTSYTVSIPGQDGADGAFIIYTTVEVSVRKYRIEDLLFMGDFSEDNEENNEDDDEDEDKDVMPELEEKEDKEDEELKKKLVLGSTANVLTFIKKKGKSRYGEPPPDQQ